MGNVDAQVSRGGKDRGVGRGTGDVWRGLLLATHLAPTLAVTALVSLLASAVGVGLPQVVGLAVCVLLGQVSVGWSNDAVDADADRRAGRLDKPVVRGLVTVSQLWRAAVLALAACVVASALLLGWWAGGLHVLAVLAAWAYNLGVKDTPFSAVPYAVAFAALPLVLARLSDAAVEASSGWVVVGCGAVGVAAHLANTATDVTSDRAVGRGGLAVVLGTAATRAVAVIMLGLGAIILSAAVSSTMMLAASAVGVGVATAAAVVAQGRWLFAVVMVLVVGGAGLLVMGSALR